FSNGKKRRNGPSSHARKSASVTVPRGISRSTRSQAAASISGCVSTVPACTASQLFRTKPCIGLSNDQYHPKRRIMHTLLSREHATHLPGRFAGLWRALGRRGRAGDRSSEH